jgi:hypothetical protein
MKKYRCLALAVRLDEGPAAQQTESPYYLYSPLGLFPSVFSFRVYTFATMMNNDLSAGDRWACTVAEEIRRFKSLRPRPWRVFRYTPSGGGQMAGDPTTDAEQA